MEKLCVVCGNKIKRKRNKMFCSYKCAGLYKQNYDTCKICGKTFKRSPSNVSTKTCGSPECTRKYRAQNMPEKFMEKSREAIMTSPKTGHFETHHKAVEWRLISPQNKEYRFRNLILWADDNEDLLPISKITGNRVGKKTFIREITRLKSDNEKHTYLRDNYYGWKVIKPDYIVFDNDKNNS